MDTLPGTNFGISLDFRGLPIQILLRFMRDLKLPTKKFALDVIRYCQKLPRADEFRVIKNQLIRSATSTASNYRLSQRAKSRPDFINKMAIVEEEADESLFWLECLKELATRKHSELDRLHDEANELVAIFVTSKKTARRSA